MEGGREGASRKVIGSRKREKRKVDIGRREVESEGGFRIILREHKPQPGNTKPQQWCGFGQREGRVA